jgi:MFS family permease
MEKNIKLFKIYSLFDELIIIGPIIVLYLFLKGLEFSQIMYLHAFSAVVIVIFEVPTGAIADKIGRKFSIALSKILWMVSLIIYIAGTGFTHFLLAEFIFSIGITLKSGADSALLYDSLIYLDRTDEFTEIQGKARSNIYIAQAFGSIIASLVYSIDANLPLIFSIGFMGIALIVVLLFTEPPIEGKKGRYGEKYHIQIIESGKYVLKHPNIRSVMIFAMIFFALTRSGFWLFQPYMESVSIPVIYFGTFFFVFNMIAALFSRNAYRILKWTGNRTMVMMVALLGVSFLLMGLLPFWFAAGFIALQQMGRGLYTPVINKYSNKHIPSDKRSTVLSFISLATSLSAAIVLPIVGNIKDHMDVFQTHLILAAAAFVLAFWLRDFLKRHIPSKDNRL